MRLRSALLLSLATAALAGLVWAAMPASTSSADLATCLPAGALMTVDSPDFGKLVQSWLHSPEQRAWLSSANYSAFTNSRLFARLSDAQNEFASAARMPLGTSFLQQVAGKESIFAWYNIGNLEFLYITHLPPDRLNQLNLLEQRGSFQRREAAGTPFFVRTSDSSTTAEEPAAADQTAAQTPDQPGAAGLNQSRTVAFAIRGDWLLLATREDLIANALQLMAAHDKPTSAEPLDSQATAAWYAAASAAGPQHHGVLHMLLDLQSLTRTPQFRTYWIQRNVSDTRQYRAAVVDLYRDPHSLREERVLLPMDSTAASEQASSPTAAQPDLAADEALAPERTGIYRVVASPSTDLALATLQEKILSRTPATSASTSAAPIAETAISPLGSPTDFETRIDTPPPASQAPDAAFAPLHQVLAASQLTTLMTVGRSDPPPLNQVFITLPAAVVLRSAAPWNTQALSSAILAALRPQLTTSSLGLDWKPLQSSHGTYLSLGPTHPVSLYVDGPLAILSTNQDLMTDLLAHRSAANPPALNARLIASFNHTQERDNFRRLTSQLGFATPTNTLKPQDPDPDSPHPVDLFRDILPSLSDAFSQLDSEHLIERRDGPVIRQTVVYRWLVATP